MRFLRCLGYLDFVPEVKDEQMAFLHLFFVKGGDERLLRSFRHVCF